MLFQCFGDCAAGDGVTDVFQRSLDPTVAPARVVGGHADDEGADLLHDAGGGPTFARACPLGCYQAVLPSENRVRRHDGGDLILELATERLAPRCEPVALVIAKPKAPPFELLFQDAVLIDEVIDDFGLLAVAPVFVRRQREGVEGGSSHVSCPEFMAT